MKKASFFDIDGTLIKSQIIFEFPRYLHKAGLFDEKHLLKIMKIIVKYEVNLLSYRDAGMRILKIYAEALSGRRKSEIERKAADFAEGHIKKKYAYTEGLIGVLKKYTVLVAISASPIEAVEALRKYIPFRCVFGTELEVKNGVYTGKIRKNMLGKNSKRRATLEISKKLKIDLKKSLAFGDSDADVEYLSMVGYPVALNPNRHLKDAALRNGWLIFHEKDDVVGKVKGILDEIS